MRDKLLKICFLSRNVDSQGRLERDLSFFSSFGLSDGFFNKVFTTAVLKSEGSVPDVSDSLKISMSYFCAPALSTLTAM